MQMYQNVLTGSAVSWLDVSNSVGYILPLPEDCKGDQRSVDGFHGNKQPNKRMVYTATAVAGYMMKCIHNS